MKIVTDSTELDQPKQWQNCNVYALCKLFMNNDELKELQKRYETPGEGYGHFKLTLLDKINEYLAPYQDKREYYLNNPSKVKEALDFGAKKAQKIAKAKLEQIREIVGLKY